MKLIINADDFGFSPEVNHEITSLAAAGRLTSATLMANGDGFLDAVRQIPALPRCSFGVHLALTDLVPLSSSKVFAAAGLMNENGRFNDAIRQIRPSKALKEAVFTEWSLQIRKVLDHGVAISHIDSHHHVHTIPWLLGTVKRLQKEYGINRVRSTLNWYYRPETNPSALLLLKKRIWSTALKYWPRTATTDHFTSFDWFVKNMTSGEVRTNGIAELMVHPGQTYAVDETKLLWSDWQAKMPCPIELINYREF